MYIESNHACGHGVFQIKVKNFRLREWYTDTTIGQNYAF